VAVRLAAVDVAVALAVVDLAIVDLPAVDLANVVDLAAGGLADVDLAAVEFVDFAARVAVEAVAFVVDCLVVDWAIVNPAGAITAKAANRATGMELANARKDSV
jgi:hypothetical protein